MKCRLRKDIKEFIIFLLWLGVLGVLGYILCLIVGYIALQVFDLAVYSGYVTSPLAYYLMNGFGILMLVLLTSGAIALVGLPIYWSFRYFIIKGFNWKSIKEIFLECE